MGACPGDYGIFIDELDAIARRVRVCSKPTVCTCIIQIYILCA